MASTKKTREDYEAEVRSWGFSNILTWTDGPNAYYSPHSHDSLTTHLIVEGQLTITYPRDDNPSKTTYSVGDRVDVDARRVHEVWIGPQGCTMVLGD
ncbi:hypothetical protein ONZ43_g213 [Nemania bipapillata]|uniref:Uncharacterized protein n=1 Tax=Nemania bipapillata TaxID=110536 RepID=A0ACC2J8X9_9PEZI|nr:hypothetical protein ONZ43_g213 [Nemania bipapillata]